MVDELLETVKQAAGSGTRSNPETWVKLAWENYHFIL